MMFDPKRGPYSRNSEVVLVGLAKATLGSL
jgi:hypothetical protein